MDINDQTFEVNSIKNLTSEHDESMEMEIETEFDLESEDFNLDEIIDSAVDWASSPSVPHQRTKISDFTSNESIPYLEFRSWDEVHLGLMPNPLPNLRSGQD